jgi:GntR family transcriptional regulator/MocR family aminotransferase
MDTRSSFCNSKETSLGASGKKTIPKTSYFLDSRSSVPLFEQLYQQVRDDILTGRLERGGKLPSSRAWAARLGVSRTTILPSRSASRRRLHRVAPASALRITSKLPEDSQRRTPVQSATARPLAIQPPVRLNAMAWPVPRNYGSPRPFQMAVPALDAFPSGDWARLSTAIWRKPPLALLNYLRSGVATRRFAAPSPGISPPSAACAANRSR